MKLWECLLIVGAVVGGILGIILGLLTSDYLVGDFIDGISLVDFVAGIPVEAFYVFGSIFIFLGFFGIIGKGSSWVVWIGPALPSTIKGRPAVIVGAGEMVVGIAILVLTLIFR